MVRVQHFSGAIATAVDALLRIIPLDPKRLDARLRMSGAVQLFSFREALRMRGNRVACATFFRSNRNCRRRSPDRS